MWNFFNVFTQKRQQKGPETRKNQSGYWIVSLRYRQKKGRKSMFPVRNFAFPQHKHTLTTAEIRDSWNGKLSETCKKKCSASLVKAATETWKTVMYPLTQTRVCRCVSSTESGVSAMFKFTDSCFFVMCYDSELSLMPAFLLVPICLYYAFYKSAKRQSSD